MEFQVLGRLGYRTGAAWVHPRGALRHRLLGVLLARAGQVVSYDALTEVLWPVEDDAPGPPDRAVARLHLHAHRFRQDLDSPDRLVADRTGYLLQVACEELDAARFAELAAGALALDPQDPSRGDLARRALAQWPDPWGGTAYPDLDVPLISDEAQRLEQLRLDVTEVLFDAEVRLGRHPDVLADLERVAAAHPLREPLQVTLMQGLHQAGRPAEALEVYARTRRQLVDELGLEPSEPLRRMQEFVLSGRSPASPTTEAEHIEVAVPAPAQLPPVVPLVGRGPALEQLDRALSGGQARHALISGLPGVGKSSLAVTWIAQHRDEFPDGQLFLDLQGYGPAPQQSVDTALDRLIRALGGDPAGLRDTEERVATYRSRLAGKRVAVLVDNARTEEQVRPFLPADPGCVSVITSRDQLAGLVARENAHHVPLQPLGREDAVSLLRSLVGATDHPQDDSAPGAASANGAEAASDRLGRLAERCAGLPVALRVAALRARDADLQDPAQDLATAQEDVLDLLDLGDPMTSARTVFSWSVDALAPPDARLFTALGVNAGNRIDVGGLAALADTDARAARRGVERLVRANLAQLDSGWVHQHDLLAAYARELASELDRPERDRMVHRLLAYYLERVQAVHAMTKAGQDHCLFRDLREANQWLDRAAEPLVALVERAPVSAGSAVTTLSRGLGSALTGRGVLELAKRLHRTAVAVAERDGDLSAASTAMQSLAAVTGKLGDHVTAEGQWDRARELAIASGDPIRLAVVHNNYTNPLMFRGQFLRVWGHLSLALRLCEKAGDGVRGQAIRSNVGFILLLLERHEQAEPVLRTLVEESAHADARSFALRNLAMLELREGRLRDAEGLILEGIELATQISNHVLRTELGSLLGQTRFRLGDPAAARQLLLRALEEASEQGEQPEIAVCLIGLARVEAADEPRRAVARLEEALARARREGLREAEFRTLLAFADVSDTLGQEARADGLRDLAGAIRQQCGLPAVQPYEAW